MAIIGTGGRGNQVYGGFSRHTDQVFLAACDVAGDRLGAFVTSQGRMDTYTDYRRILDRKDIDAVLITTPDHHSGQHAVAKNVMMLVPADGGGTEQIGQRMIEMPEDHRGAPGGEGRLISEINHRLSDRADVAVLDEPGAFLEVRQLRCCKPTCTTRSDLWTASTILRAGSMAFEMGFSIHTRILLARRSHDIARFD
jgi:hypothetical protein